MLVHTQEKRISSLARDWIYLEVYEINPPDCEEKPYPIYWVVNKKTNKGYEADLELVRCTCYDYRVLHRQAVENMFREGRERKWIFCKHSLKAGLVAGQVERGEATINYIEHLPELCWSED